MNQFVKFLILMLVICSTKISAQWVQTSGPYGGKVNCFTFQGSSLFAGTYDGIFKSTNFGLNWRKIGLESQNITALTSIGNYLFAGSISGGVFLSINDGNTWSQINDGLTNRYVKALAIITNNIFAGTEDGVFHSSNLGSYWVKVNNGLTNRNVHCLFASGNNLFAGTNDGVFISSNNGANWNPFNSGIRNTTVYSIVASGNNVFIGTDSSGVLRSTDLGYTWQQTNLNNIDVRALTLSGTALLAGTYGGGIYRTINNGSSWSSANSGLTNSYIFNFIIYGSSNILSATSDGIFLSTNNGENWMSRNIGLTNHTVNALAFSGTNLFGGTDNGIFLTTNNGTSWMEVGLNNQYVHSFAVQGSYILVGSNGAYVSSDNGTTWTKRGLEYYDIFSLEIIFPRIFATTSYSVYRSSFYSSNWETVFDLYSPHMNRIITKRDTILFLGTTKGIYTSTNFGTNWQQIGFMSFVDAIAFSDTFILAGTNDGLFRKGLNETNWIKVSFRDTAIQTLTASGRNLFAGTRLYGVFLSTNNGTSWIDVNTDLANKRIRCLAISNQNLFIGTYAGGVWRRPLSEMITSIELTSDELPNEFVLEQNYPNPFNPSTTIEFRIPHSAFITLKVYDVLGREVSTLVSEELSAGRYAYQWDAAGLPSGVYFYRLEAVDPSTSSGQRFVQTKKMILLR